jgi:hypothetical protein
MNERIQELWTQAEEEIKAEYEDESRRNRRLYNEILLPKFAELIVRECIAICQDVDGEDNIDAKSGRQDCAVEIREHFGVEP